MAADMNTKAAAKSTLHTYSVYSVLPILIECNGSHTVLRNKSAALSRGIHNILLYKLGEPAEQFDQKIIDKANYIDIAFSLPSLYEWSKQNQLEVDTRDWSQWMKTCYSVLKTRGLLAEPDTQSSNNELAPNKQSDRTIDYPTLQALSGYRTPADVTAWLTNQNIQYKTGIRNRPFTTIDAINSALGVSNSRNDTKRTIAL